MATLQEVKVPELGEGIEKASVIAILVKVGDTVQAQQALIEVESDKASVEIPAPFVGKVTEVRVQLRDEIRTGQTILILDCNETSQASKQEPPKQAPTVPPSTSTEKEENVSAIVENQQTPPTPLVANSEQHQQTLVPAAPSVRRLARELGVDIHQVTPSGVRISYEDVKAYVKNTLTQGSSSIPSKQVTTDLPDFSRFGSVRYEQMSSICQKIAAKMELCWQQIPHVSQFDEADITAFENFRNKKNKQLRKQDIKLTPTSILVKITALALTKFPQFNASLDMKSNQIIYKDYVHLGVAVDTPQGLLVPVIRDAAKKDIVSIARELTDLSSRARERKIRPDEMQGACITLTNLGGLGTTYFTPIINWPEVAILGVGMAKRQLSQTSGEVKSCLMLPLSLSYDHRLIDGANAAHFLRWIAENLEYPLEI